VVLPLHNKYQHSIFRQYPPASVIYPGRAITDTQIQHINANNLPFATHASHALHLVTTSAPK
jgi:hypothetical protein